ncbi:hypothetical protein G9A89_000485 [Geosiphon pyriformis]|nr:hypothetical protein G9A89_000485 [Geosiphon pyriformis]
MEMGIRTKVSEAIRDGTISVTVDHWSSIAKDNFVGITVHWIDKKWSLQSKQIDSILLSITSDTTGNMNRFGFAMEDAGVHHIYCTDHVLELTAKETHKTQKDAYHPSQLKIVTDVVTRWWSTYIYSQVKVVQPCVHVMYKHTIISIIYLRAIVSKWCMSQGWIVNQARELTHYVLPGPSQNVENGNFVGLVLVEINTLEE